MSAIDARVNGASLVATKARTIHARRHPLTRLAEVLCALLGSFTVLALLQRAPVLWLFASHGDSSDFYHAARAAMAGRDPYAVPLYHYFPALTQLLRPLNLFSQETAYKVWLLFLALVQVAALTVLVRRWGWHVVPTTLALTPMLLIGFMVSQPVPLLVLTLAGAVSCLERGRATLAGAFPAVAWLKAQVALPAVCLFVALRPRAALGFALARLALLALLSLPAWLHAMRGFDVERETVQASLAGLWHQETGQQQPSKWYFATRHATQAA